MFFEKKFSTSHATHSEQRAFRFLLYFQNWFIISLVEEEINK